MNTARSSRRALSLATVAGLAVASFGAPAAAQVVDEPGTSTDLIISEYVEGSSNNKALEFFNGTGAPIELDGYTVEFYFNGSSDPAGSIALAGSVAAGDVFVLADDDAVAAILAEADAEPTNSFFNGDDAIVLRGPDGGVVDSLGQVGFDPGSEWGAGDTSTQNNTIRRRASVCSGDTDPTDVFDPALEWEGFALDTFDGLGSHSNDCAGGGGDGGGGGGGDEAVVVINEVDADQASIDDAEFVELFDGGVGGTDLSGLSLVFFNGSDDASYEAFDLDGLSTGDDGFFVLCGDAGNVANCDLDVSPDTNLVQNGADAVALFRADASDFPEDTPVTTVGLIDAIVYGTGDDADEGLLVLLTSGGQVDEDGNDRGSTESSQRCPDGAGELRSTLTYTLFTPTPGATNCVTPPPPPPPALDCTTQTPILISTIQGSGSQTTFGGQDVVVEGVVTGVFPGLSGFTVQEEISDSDGDPSTSEGIFVFGSDFVDLVSVGETVRVAGEADEYVTSGGASSLTQIRVDAVVSCDLGTPGEVATTEITLPLESADALEAVESMLVTAPQSLAISEYFNYDRFGEVVVRSERLYQPTALVDPGPEALALAEAYALDRLTIDDGSSTQNPDPAIHPGNGEEFTLDNRFRGGDTITGITGVISESFGLYRLQPTVYGTYTSVNPRTAEPADVGGDVTVATFNVLNYFTTLDGNGDICGPAADSGCRGADDAEEFERQKAKIVAAITTIDADVVGLIEIENDASENALRDLVAGLNDATAPGTYAAILTGSIGTDAIRVALVYQPANVTPFGEYAILDSSVDPRFDDGRNRPALAQSFQDGDGAVFTVVVNHLKSKGSECGEGDDSTDGAASCDATRTAAAEALVDWVATDPTGSGDPDALIIGDLNSYDEEDPIDAIIEGADDVLGTDDDWTDLVTVVDGPDAYSYVFDGLLGHLDYAMSSFTLTPQVTGTTVWNINADEPDILDYDTGFKRDAQDALYEPNPYRSSDHDPVIVGLDLTTPVLDLDVATALVVTPGDRPSNVVLTATLEGEFDSCPATLTASVDGADLIGVSLRSVGPRCIGVAANGVVLFDPASARLKVTARADLGEGGDSRTFTVTADEATYAAEVDGVGRGVVWAAR